MSSPLFGVIPAGQSLITDPTSVVSDLSFLYSLSQDKPFVHLAVCLLPGVILPPGTAAAIYLATSAEVAAATSNGQTPNFKFLGGIGPGKESAIFKIGESARGSTTIVLGISVESATSVASRIEELPTATSVISQNDRVFLAQKIIKNAFTFLTSFSGTAGVNQVEVVPLKAFEDWWRKFEGRIRSDPTFLDRPSD